LVMCPPKWDLRTFAGLPPMLIAG